MVAQVGKSLRTPRAAAGAGIAFSLLLGAVYVLLRLSIPTDPNDSEWLSERASFVRLALALVPFAGIAFLWFMGVLRDRIGDSEDRFFSTVYTGSGLLFLAMVFVAAAGAGSLLATYARVGNSIVDSGVYSYVRDMIYVINNVYSVRMAAVFMFSLGTVGIRTKYIPVWLSIVTYVLALSLLLVISHNLWVSLVFPAWVLVVSVYLLFTNFHSNSQSDTPANSG
ncbi:MAG TPA: hypothetical protein VIW94_10675 [Acidimicrobiia bacterium]